MRLVQILSKRCFNNWLKPVEAIRYHEHVQKLLSADMDTMKDILFRLLDLNRDNRVCETDMFNVVHMLEGSIMQRSLGADV